MSPFFLFGQTIIDLKSLCTGSNYIATLTLGSAGAHASYYHKANDQVTFLIVCQPWLKSSTNSL